MQQRLWIGAIQTKDMGHLPVTIIETRSFRKDAMSVLSEEDLVELKMQIATNPGKGIVVPQTGGVRKLRYPAKGKGKRGGARIIYYYLPEGTPIFLLAFYTKGERSELTMQEKSKIRELTREIAAVYNRQSLRVVS